VYRIIAIAIVLFILASAGYAQVPSGNVFVGYSYMSADLDRHRGSHLGRDESALRSTANQTAVSI
jgi:hypothetical protein